MEYMHQLYGGCGITSTIFPQQSGYAIFQVTHKSQRTDD